MATINGTAGNDVLNGTSTDDSIFGYAGNDTINGGSGNDVIDAGSGADTVSGGAGNDRFNMSSVSSGLPNSFYDGGTGTDTLDYSVSASYMFWSYDTNSGIYNVRDVDFDNIETIIGSSGQDIFNYFLITDSLKIYGGNGSDNIYTGSGNDTIYGQDGDDTITGGSGINYVYGDTGNDYIGATSGSGTVDGGDGIDTVEAFIRVDLSLGKAYGFYESYNVLNIENIVVGSAADQAFGIGNDSNNRIVINSIFREYTSAVFEGRGGNDFLQGGSLADQLNGGDGDDTLDGLSGADRMVGEAGNDTYYVDNAGDVVVETSTGGSADSVFSSVSYGLATAYIETLTLTGEQNINGTGNNQNQTINGNTGNNVMLGLGGNDVLNGDDGDDTLDGGTGTDRLVGGDGNDIYYVNKASDVVVETSSGGSADHVFASSSFDLAKTYVEFLTLTGSGNTNGTGNSQAQTINGNTGNNVLLGLGGNDILNGGDGNDTLDGGTGADRMVGGNGNDIYYVNNASDVVMETATGGVDDQVFASASFSIAGTYVEKLTLTGSSNINGTGNSKAQTITGNVGNNILSGREGNDTLHGKLGADTLVGGSGADRFVFDTSLGGSNVDRISDFEVGVDKIHLEGDIFTGLPNGALLGSAFHIGAQAHDADDRIIFDQASGALWFDADGSGVGGAVQFATLNAGLSLAAADFLII